MKFAFASPAGTMTDTRCGRTVRQALVYAERKGFHMVAELGVPGQHLIMGRNFIVDQALKDINGSYDGIMWVDSDMMIPYDSIVELLTVAKQIQADFIAVPYYKRMPDHGPTCGEFRGADRDGFALIKWTVNLEKRGLERLTDGACGFGFTYTSMNLLRRLEKRPFTKLPFIYEPGDDYSFCWRVKELNPPTPLWIYNDIRLGHMGVGMPVTQDDFVALQLKQEAEKKAQEEKK